MRIDDRLLDTRILLLGNDMIPLYTRCWRNELCAASLLVPSGILVALAPSLDGKNNLGQLLQFLLSAHIRPKLTMSAKLT
jgi:hypothetical protein